MSLMSSVEARLQLRVPDEFKQVGSALSLAQVVTRAPQAGISVWPVMLSDRPSGDQRTAGPALQKSVITIGVIIAIRSVNDPRGDKGLVSLEGARKIVQEQLFGWTPDDALVPCLLAPGELIKMDNATIWWMDRYTTSVQYRAPQS